MLEYNGEKYFRSTNPQIASYEQVKNKLQNSTASVSSNKSMPNYSMGKFSFKTGTVLNNHTNKKYKQTNFQHSLNLNPIKFVQKYQNSAEAQQKGLVFDNKKNVDRSKSHNSTIHYFSRIPSPPRRSYIYQQALIFSQNSSFNNTKLSAAQNCAINNDEIQFIQQRKRSLKQQSNLLKKSISERKMRFQSQHGQLKFRLGSLMSQYIRQQAHMARITAVVNEYFS